MRAKDVKKIVAKMGDWAIKTLANPEDRKRRPQTYVDAQFSLFWAIAVAICKNRTGADEFSTKALNDPDVLALAQKIGWEFDPAAEAMYPRAYPATVVAELNDGRRLQAHVDYPKGDPENPVTRDEIIAKFHGLTKNYFDSTRREKIIAKVNRLEELPNIAELADLVR